MVDVHRDWQVAISLGRNKILSIVNYIIEISFSLSMSGVPFILRVFSRQVIFALNQYSNEARQDSNEKQISEKVRTLMTGWLRLLVWCLEVVGSNSWLERNLSRGRYDSPMIRNSSEPAGQSFHLISKCLRHLHSADNPTGVWAFIIQSVRWHLNVIVERIPTLVSIFNSRKALTRVKLCSILSQRNVAKAGSRPADELWG